MFERLSCCDPFGRIDGQHLINEIFGFRSHCVPFRRGKLGRGGGRGGQEGVRRRGGDKIVLYFEGNSCAALMMQSRKECKYKQNEE